MKRRTMLNLLIPITAVLLVHCTQTTAIMCPDMQRCEARCCVTGDGAYFCCDPLHEAQRQSSSDQRSYPPGTIVTQFEWGWLVISLIVSIVVSVVLSVLCCVFCSGCWWYQRRHQRPDADGFVGFGTGIPSGTIVISNQQPRYYPDDTSTINSGRSSRQHVTFSDNEDEYETRPKSVLKKTNHNTMNQIL